MLVFIKQTETDAEGNFNYHHFLAIYDPIRAPHELCGMSQSVSVSDLNLSRIASSDQGQGSGAPESNSTMTASASEGALEGVGDSGRAAKELKRMWQSALRRCKAADSDKSGFVSREVFISALEEHLGKVRRYTCRLMLVAVMLICNIDRQWIRRGLCHLQTRTPSEMILIITLASARV